MFLSRSHRRRPINYTTCGVSLPAARLSKRCGSLGNQTRLGVPSTSTSRTKTVMILDDDHFTGTMVVDKRLPLALQSSRRRRRMARHRRCHKKHQFDNAPEHETTHNNHNNNNSTRHTQKSKRCTIVFQDSDDDNDDFRPQRPQPCMPPVVLDQTTAATTTTTTTTDKTVVARTPATGTTTTRKCVTPFSKVNDVSSPAATPTTVATTPTSPSSSFSFSSSDKSAVGDEHATCHNDYASTPLLTSTDNNYDDHDHDCGELARRLSTMVYIRKPRERHALDLYGKFGFRIDSNSQFGDAIQDLLVDDDKDEDEGDDKQDQEKNEAKNASSLVVTGAGKSNSSLCDIGDINRQQQKLQHQQQQHKDDQISQPQLQPSRNVQQQQQQVPVDDTIVEEEEEEVFTLNNNNNNNGTDETPDVPEEDQTQTQNQAVEFQPGCSDNNLVPAGTDDGTTQNQDSHCCVHDEASGSNLAMEGSITNPSSTTPSPGGDPKEKIDEDMEQRKQHHPESTIRQAGGTSPPLRSADNNSNRSDEMQDIAVANENNGMESSLTQGDLEMDKKLTRMNVEIEEIDQTKEVRHHKGQATGISLTNGDREMEKELVRMNDEIENMSLLEKAKVQESGISLTNSDLEMEKELVRMNEEIDQIARAQEPQQSTEEDNAKDDNLSSSRMELSSPKTSRTTGSDLNASSSTNGPEQETNKRASSPAMQIGSSPFSKHPRQSNAKKTAGCEISSNNEPAGQKRKRKGAPLIEEEINVRKEKRRQENRFPQARRGNKKCTPKEQQRRQKRGKGCLPARHSGLATNPKVKEEEAGKNGSLRKKKPEFVDLCVWLDEEQDVAKWKKPPQQQEIFDISDDVNEVNLEKPNGATTRTTMQASTQPIELLSDDDSDDEMDQVSTKHASISRSNLGALARGKKSSRPSAPRRVSQSPRTAKSLDARELFKPEKSATTQVLVPCSISVPPRATPTLSEETRTIVSESSDSSVANDRVEYTYKAHTPVGICERIAKNDDLTVEYDTRDESKGDPYSFDQFISLWHTVEEQEIKRTTTQIEKSNEFRRANYSVRAADSSEQKSAIYGRILPQAMETIFTFMGLKKEHIFLDLGHGIGNACLQASYRYGCRSKGIELVDGRFYVSEAFHKSLAKVAQDKKMEDPSHWDKTTGMVELKHGRLEDPTYREWLTVDVDRVFVNNFNDVFGSRSACRSEAHNIDSKIAALFATMKAGSVMVTMNPIDALGLTRERVLAHRKKHALKTPFEVKASFFKMEEVPLGKANESVSWSENGKKDTKITMYKYTRLKQALDTDAAVFLCTNERNCEQAANATPIPAVVEGEHGLVMNFCNCKFTAIRTRGRGKCRPSRKVMEGAH